MTASSPNPDQFPPPHEHSPGDPGGLPRYTPSADQYGQHRGPVPAPPQHRRLLSLTLVSAGLYLLSGIVSMIATLNTDLGEIYERMGVPADQAGALTGQLSGLSVAGGLIGLAVALGLYVLLYVFLKKGRNWARILGIVLAILSAVSVLFGFLGTWLYGAWAIPLIAIGIAFIVVNILWLVTAFKAPVARWFTQQP